MPKSSPEICVAQLHAGGRSGSSPFVMIDYKSGRLYVMVAIGTSAAASFYTLLTNVPVGASLSCRLADNGNGTLTIGAVSGNEQGTVSKGSNDGGKVLFTVLTQS